MRRAARHVQIDDALNLRREVRLMRSQRIDDLGTSRSQALAPETRQCDCAQTELTGAAQKTAPRHLLQLFVL